MNKHIQLDGASLTIEQVVEVARHGYTVSITDAALAKMKKSRDYVDALVEEGRVVYGITTGFGKFSDVFISKEDAQDLQRNLIISHACGVGDPLNEETARAIMLLRINTLTKGHSGIRISTVNTLIDMLNKGVHPIIPEKGSLGASGDLAPLSNMVLVMLGEGEAIYKGVRYSGREAMEKAGIEVIHLTSKEGLALINGTQVMTAIGALAVHDGENLLKQADIIASMTHEALRGITCAYDEKVHAVRGQVGQMHVAKNMLRITEGSSLTTKQGEVRVQDAYTLRCIPQIHGASRDAIAYVRRIVEIEINAATDNPLIFPDQDQVISGGNFHGQPVALSMDFMGIAFAEMANVSERRTERLVNPQLNDLPPFLTKKGGLHSGFMIAQYAAAALVSENKVLAHPASVDSIPSSANQEDHVSMGTIGARKGRAILDNVQKALAIEAFAAAQALMFRGDVVLGKGTTEAYKVVSASVQLIDEDRIMYTDINRVDQLIKNAEILKAVETKIGAL